MFKIINIIFIFCNILNASTYDLSVNQYNNNPINSKKGFTTFYSNGKGFITYTPYRTFYNNELKLLETKININYNNEVNSNIYLNKIDYIKIKKLNSNKLAFYDIDYIWKFNIGTNFDNNQYYSNFINVGLGDSIDVFGENISYFLDCSINKNDSFTNYHPNLNLEYSNEYFNSKISYTYDINNYEDTSTTDKFLSLDFLYKINEFKNLYYSFSKENNLNILHTIGLVMSF